MARRADFACAATLTMRLEAKLEPITETGCFIYTGYVAGDGYGAIGVGQRTVRAHRLAWELVHGAIPKGMLVCHKCDTPRCCRVDHLFLGTPAENSADMCSKGRQSRGRETTNRATVLNETSAMRIFEARGLQREIAAKFGVSVTTVSEIKSKKKWRFIHAAEVRHD